ncbi:hypothetical protein H5410_045907 [Solanum commersonii]|uniref:Uncharacterized protein n=1 Tax=Solanum commersonii TaxID=4109 RepID=A0A9J5XAU0_SOLCO|nr:hypothetical protein H5410_045907 [Solanum commersonii]
MRQDLRLATTLARALLGRQPSKEGVEKCKLENQRIGWRIAEPIGDYDLICRCDLKIWDVL